MRLLLSILLLLPVSLVYADGDIEFPTLAKSARNVQQFIPDGWKLLTKAEGDLNRDNKDDLVFVLESKSTYTPNTDEGKPYSPRIVGIALWNADESIFELKVQENNFIPTTEGSATLIEDPLESVLIKNGTARFYFHYIDNGKMYITDQTFIFYYNKNRQFELGGFVRSKLHRSTQAYTRESINYSTGKSTLLKRTNDSEIGATSDVTFKADKVYTIHDIGKARSFKPQEIKYSEFAGTY